MKLPHYTKRDRWFMLIIVPPEVMLINYLVFGMVYFERADIFIVSSIISGLIAYACSRLLLTIALQMQQRYPLYNQTFERLSKSLFYNVLFTFLTITLVFFGYDLLNLFNYDVKTTNYKMSVLAGLGLNLTATSLIEGFAYYEQWKRATDEAEELKNENLQTQLSSLKAQVQPHFLFNSLNTLCSLISEDPYKAEAFLLNLSKVYRYLLISSEENLALLSGELQFIKSYFQLLKTRYVDSVILTIQVDERFLSYKLPSLTLQLLVENAVKHNIVEKERPLTILIATTNDGKLIVSNNLQRKTRGVNSNKVGLNNISKKYKLLKQEDIEVNVSKENFSVIIPLLKNGP